MSCLPTTYSYVPTFVPGNTSCLAPVYESHRARILVGGISQLFIRSKLQRLDQNNISVELAEDLINSGTYFNVYFNDVLTTRYPVAVPATGAISTLRSMTAADPTCLIELPALKYDIYDTRITEKDGDGTLIPGLLPFERVNLVGGNGPPEDATPIANIRTGPSRTLYILRTYEDLTGKDEFPPPSERVKQWNGSQWISYCNNVQGLCPGEGSC